MLYLLLLLQQFLPCIEIRDCHTEGLPADFLREFFIMCPRRRVCHCLPRVVNRFGEALAVCLLGLAPLDVGHIGGLHDGLFAVHHTVGQFSDLAAIFVYCRVQFYFHGSLPFLCPPGGLILERILH